MSSSKRLFLVIFEIEFDKEDPTKAFNGKSHNDFETLFTSTV